MTIRYTLAPVVLTKKGVPGLPFGSQVYIVAVNRTGARGFMTEVKPKTMRAGDRVCVRPRDAAGPEKWVEADDLAELPSEAAKP